MTTGQRIQQARKAANLSQRQLGKLLNISGSMIAQYENNLRNPKQKSLERIAGVLDVSADWLRTGLTTEQLRNPNEHNIFKMQLDSLLELIGFLGNPQNERKILNNYAQLALALTELQRAISEKPDVIESDEKELETMRRIELFAKLCSDSFSDLQNANPGGYAQTKDTFNEWLYEKQKFDSLLTDYLKLNQAGRKIVSNAAKALTMSDLTAKSD